MKLAVRKQNLQKNAYFLYIVVVLWKKIKLQKKENGIFYGITSLKFLSENSDFKFKL